MPYSGILRGRRLMAGRLSVRTVRSMLDSQDGRANGDFFDLTTHHDERRAADAASAPGLEDGVPARAARSAAHDAARLELVAGQPVRRYGSDLEADADGLAQRLLHAAHAGGVLELDQHADLVDLAVAEHFDLEFVDHREAADDALDRRGKDVDAADDEHVVEPAEDATLQERKRPPARARRRGEARTVAGTETDHGRADAPEVGEDELAVARGPSGHRVNDLGDELEIGRASCRERVER